MTSTTRHLLYVDESGGHDLRHVDPNWPIFVLVGLLVGETYYAHTLVRRIKRLKERNGIARQTPLHSRSIRRHEGAFRVLDDPAIRNRLYADLNELFQTTRIRLYAVVIDKRRFANRYIIAPSPYDVSLSQLLSVVCGPPGIPTINRPNVAKITAESRGRTEDKQLQAEYQQFRKYGLGSYSAGGVRSRRPSTVRRVFPSRIDFVKKSPVIGGLELADLAAYPIGRAYVKNEWDNPAFLAVSSRLRGVVWFP